MRPQSKILRFLLAVLILSILGVPASGQDEQWLQYRSSPDAGQIVGDMGYQYKDTTAKAPEGVPLPDLTAESPRFLLWETPMAASGRVWIAFDKSNAEGIYDRLYIDADVDGDLSDESPQEPSRRDNYYAYFGPVKTVFDTEDGPITYHLNFRLYTREERNYCLVSPGCWYEGPVSVGGQKKHCVLIDQNTNGTFNDTSADFGRCDRIRIGQPGNRDTRLVGKYFEVDDKLYRTEIAKDGAFIILTAADDVPYGTVSISEDITTFAAGGANGLFVRRPEDGRIRLPVGEYRLDYWTIKRKDDRSARWELRGSRGGVAFTVREDEPTKLLVGEPVYSRLSVQSSGSAYTFGQSLEGRQGERIELTRNGSRPQPPKLRIRSRDGTYDRGLAFEYG